MLNVPSFTQYPLPNNHLEIIFICIVSAGAEAALDWAKSHSPPRIAGR